MGTVGPLAALAPLGELIVQTMAVDPQAAERAARALCVASQNPDFPARLSANPLSSDALERLVQTASPRYPHATHALAVLGCHAPNAVPPELQGATYEALLDGGSVADPGSWIPAWAAEGEEGRIKQLRRLGQGLLEGLRGDNLQDRLGQEALTAGVRNIYDRPLVGPEGINRNLALSADSGIVDHHFGVGEFDSAKLEKMSPTEIAEVLRAMEEQQARYLIGLMGEVRPEHRVLDAGSGDGGTAFRLHRTKGCEVIGITLAPNQARFATAQSREWDRLNRVRFLVMNFLRMGFADQCFDHIFSNETTMYVTSLRRLFAEYRRVLKVGGRYTLATWNINDRYGPNNPFVKPINDHYVVHMHTDREYRRALQANGFCIDREVDLTEGVIPHWEVRSA